MTEPPKHRPLAGGRVARTAPLVGLAGRTAGEAVVAALCKRGTGTEFHARNAERYAERLGRSRGVLMKAGQLLSFVSLGSIVSDDYQGVYQAAFAKLRDDAPPMPPDLAEETVEAELGHPVSRLFAAFDPRPLAAASIGQVHAATLPDGRRVAVKVQYPGVERAIKADLANTELLATFFQLVRGMMPDLARMDVRALASEVSDRIGEEIDYRVEATNQQRFADAYRAHPFIRIPEVVPELSTRRVLTMDLVEGQRYAEALQADTELRNRWGEAIFRFCVGNLRSLRLFNADPHPGNYLFHSDGSVTFLDFGCVKQFSERQVRVMQRLAQAARDQDPEQISACAVAAGFVDAADPPDHTELLGWFSESLKPIVAPQPFTYTPEFAASVVQSEFSPSGPFSGVVRKLTVHSDYLFLSRIDLGMTAVLGALGATGPWNSIREEWDCAGPPATPYGELELAYRAVHT
jgi:predicted unusual protein kinase regulating ubiquinone biosynthesis (AarF/ABC1/UbiB family)